MHTTLSSAIHCAEMLVRYHPVSFYIVPVEDQGAARWVALTFAELQAGGLEDRWVKVVHPTTSLFARAVTTTRPAPAAAGGRPSAAPAGQHFPFHPG